MKVNFTLFIACIVTQLLQCKTNDIHNKWVPVITAWHFLKLWMEKWPPIWRVAVNILNKQSRTADRGLVLQLGVWGRCWQILAIKTDFVANHEHLPRTFIDTFVWPKQWKMDMRFGAWNGRSQYRAGSLTAAARELARYELDLGGG